MEKPLHKDIPVSEAKRDLRLGMKHAMQKAMQEGFDEETASGLIWEKIESLPEWKAADCILCYMSVPGEVSTRRMDSLALEGKRFAIPLVTGPGTMVLKEFDPARLHAGYHGIPEPDEDCPEISPGDIQLAIVPGVAFDRGCRRLGHGRGFYDRLLPELHCPVAGVCFRWRLLDQDIPCEEWDRKMDLVITDTDA